MSFKISNLFHLPSNTYTQDDVCWIKIVVCFLKAISQQAAHLLVNLRGKVKQAQFLCMPSWTDCHICAWTITSLLIPKYSFLVTLPLCFTYSASQFLSVYQPAISKYKALTTSLSLNFITDPINPCPLSSLYPPLSASSPSPCLLHLLRSCHPCFSPLLPILRTHFSYPNIHLISLSAGPSFNPHLLQDCVETTPVKWGIKGKERKGEKQELIRGWIGQQPTRQSRRGG